LPSRHPSVPGTLAVRKDDRGAPVRVMHSSAKPECPKCNSDDHVVRIWHGGKKMWVCSKCYKVTSTKTMPASLVQRVFHRIPAADTFELNDLLPNRRYRRRRTK
jgi:ribosomal protein L37AE/L43A